MKDIPVEKWWQKKYLEEELSVLLLYLVEFVDACGLDHAL